MSNKRQAPTLQPHEIREPNRYDVEVILLKDYHPKGYRREWHDAGDIVYATCYKHPSEPDYYYLSGRGYGRDAGGVFNSDAIEGVDFRRVDENAVFKVVGGEGKTLWWDGKTNPLEMMRKAMRDGI